MLFLGPVVFYTRKDMMISKADVINWQRAAERVEREKLKLVSLIQV